METWEIGDFVTLDVEGEKLTGMIESVEDDTYTVRVMAVAGDDFEPTDRVETRQGSELGPLSEDDDDDDDMDDEKFAVGDFVTWESEAGQAVGVVTDVKSGPWTVADTGVEMDGGYAVEVYDRKGDEWFASGIVVGLSSERLSGTAVDVGIEAKRLPRLVAKVKNAETMEDEAIGHIKGYLSVFGNVDLGGDVVMKGCFRKTLMEKGGKTVFMLDHGYKTSEVIGVLSLEEDDKGLKMDGAINLATPQGRMAYETAKFQIEQGVPIGASIGYGIDKATPNAYGGYDLHEVRLYEGSMTPFPMNESALITEAKRRYDRKHRAARATKLMHPPSGSDSPEADFITSAQQALKLITGD